MDADIVLAGRDQARAVGFCELVEEAEFLRGIVVMIRIADRFADIAAMIFQALKEFLRTSDARECHQRARRRWPRRDNSGAQHGQAALLHALRDIAIPHQDHRIGAGESILNRFP